MVSGLDFNFIRGQADKNNKNINCKLVNIFNDFIADPEASGIGDVWK
jgi:hypothetical protein